ncbi:PepSY domain-containing protein [Sedimenticola thiotaurini]|uniref:PepSY domain-containing protein n=1 Tax=Sedimenticola thiotaurini TaxID=1543721 RepID=A0A0F7JRE7_9GAMM|nr:PepSY domain-containing protein [Sedimenticola thiotaurini]AKH19006.1 hypothetical protein AAY24_00060 [Sedimenticola thiotaurini]
MMKMSHVLFAITLTGATVAGTAMAESDAGRFNPTMPTTDAWLEIPAVYAKVIGAGYSDVYEIERERDGYEIKAFNPEGRAVKLLVHPVTGEVLQARSKGDYKERYRYHWERTGAPM